MYIPFHISMMSKFITILPNEDGTNVAKGEIIKMLQNKGPWEFNQQVVGNKEGYNWIYRYIGLGYWKVVAKYQESPWSCQ